MEKRLALLDRMIKVYGFEHKEVIEFAEMIEDPKYDTNILEILVKLAERFPDLGEG